MMGSILQIVSSIVLFPVRALFLPFEWLFSFDPTSDDGQDDSDHEFGLGSKVGRWLRRAFGWGVGLPILLLKSPFVVMRSLLNAKRSDLLFLAPAALALGFLGFVSVQMWLGRTSIESRYRQGAYSAIQAGNFPLAKTYFTRMLDDGELSPTDQLALVGVFARTGQNEQAAQILDRLAPDEGPVGFPNAHKVKALNCAQQIGKSDDPELLKRLKRHLDCCSNESQEISQAWAAYYLGIDDIENALARLADAAQSHPQFWFSVADIAERERKFSYREKALREAKLEFQARLEKDPLDTDSRLNLAKVLTRRQDHELAEQLLLRGMKLQPDNKLRNSMAGFYVARYDDASKKAPRDFSREFSFLQKAIEADANYSVAYDRLTNLFLADASSEERDSIREVLLSQIASDDPSAMAHFALSNLLFAAGENVKAEWHLEKAYKLDDRFVVVINNLAWVLAHKKKPDLDRALELASTAVSQSPDNAEYLDTYGTVLLKCKKYDAAITNFEKALSKHQSKDEIHMKLALCYRAIERPDLAEIHEKHSIKDVK